MPISLKDFSELVSDINDTASTFSRWEPVLAKIVTATNYSSGGLLSARSSAAHLEPAYVGVDPDVVAKYNEYYHRIDPIAAAIRRTGGNGIWSNDDLVPWAVNSQTELYNDWAVPNDLNDGVFACLRDPTAGTTVLCITRQRRVDATEAKDLMRLLEPHLKRAIHIRARLGEGGGFKTRSPDALDFISHGIVVLDEAGKVGFSNIAATRMFRDAGRSLNVDREQRLRATSPKDNSSLQKIIGLALKGIDGLRPSGSIAMSHPAGRQALLVHVLPIKEREMGAAGAMVVVIDLERRPQSSTHVLRRAFNFTETEAEVAKLIMEGEGLGYVAEKLAVSLPTVRTHLQHIFDKTGVHRQAALVRLLAAAHGGLNISYQ